MGSDLIGNVAGLPMAIGLCGTTKSCACRLRVTRYHCLGWARVTGFPFTWDFVMPKLLAPITFGTRLRRLAWHITYLFIYRPTPVFAHVWRCLILKMFGAEISLDAFPYPDARIWAPWNLVMKRGSCPGPNANCYDHEDRVARERVD